MTFGGLNPAAVKQFRTSFVAEFGYPDHGKPGKYNITWLKYGSVKGVWQMNYIAPFMKRSTGTFCVNGMASTMAHRVRIRLGLGLGFVDIRVRVSVRVSVVYAMAYNFS